MNVVDIKKRVKRQFGDESGVQLTDEDIVRWINDAMREIATQNDNILETVATAAITSGTSEYSLPEDILKLHTIRYDDKKLDVLTLQEAEQSIIAYEQSGNYQSGTPVLAWIYANRVVLYPTPNTSGGSLLKIYYTRLPVEVALDADIPEFHVKYHPRIVEFVLQQAYEMDEDWAASGNKSAQFVSGLNTLKDSDSWVEQNTYPTILILPEDM
jgi:hypothetical protein